MNESDATSHGGRVRAAALGWGAHLRVAREFLLVSWHWLREGRGVVSGGEFVTLTFLAGWNDWSAATDGWEKQRKDGRCV